MIFPYPSPFGAPSAAVPVGSVVAFAGQITPLSSTGSTAWSNSACGPESGSSGDIDSTTCPIVVIEALGWMACDGRSLEVARYPELAAVLGNLYGGDSQSFNLPDYRGLFLRGVDSGAGMDPDAGSRGVPTGGQGSAQGVGSIQCDALQTHEHQYQATTPAAESTEGTAAGTLTVQPPPLTQPPNTDLSLGPVANVSQHETRPRNVYVNYLIKYRR